MNITREQLKEIIREELKTLDEKTIKTGGIKIEMSVKGGYPLLRLYGHKGYVEVYGRPDITNFCKILKKNFRIV
jgi:hypothetical protein